MALTLRTGGGLISPASAVNSNKNTSGNNNGGLIGGVGYLAEKSALGFLSSVEGIWDYSAGGVAKLFGVDKWAERQFANDWVDYTHADEWYDPGKGWQIAGDVAGGIGTSMPAIAGVGAGVGIATLSGGTLSPVAAGIISASVAGLGAAGSATKEAYQKTGNLGAKEFGYGALSGATEAAIEGVTAGIGTGTGRIVSSLSKKAAGETVQTLSKSGAKSVIKHLAADFASEAVEEGLAEAIDPLYQKLTIDPNAKAATAQEIGYAALVGGLSGLVMSGGAATVNTIANLSSGNAAINSGNAERIIQTASSISAYEDANDTGYESYKAISADYKALSESLKQTGGQITTAKQRMLLGSLKKAETAAFVEPFIERSAENLLLHADSAAERFSSFGMTDADGKEIHVTADEIRSGVDADLIRKADSGKLTEAEQKTFTKQVRAAMRSNSVLTTLATMDATGRITMDARKFAEAAREGADIATAADINAFAETASQEEIRDLAADLGIADWSSLTPDEFREKTAAFAQSDRGRDLSYQSRRIRAAMGLAEDSAVALPKAFSGDIAEGATRYRTADGIDMAIIREGDRNYIYNYASGNISRAMSEADVNKILADYWSGNKKAADDARLALSQSEVQNNVQNNVGSVQNNADLLGVAATARYNMLAAENIKGWRQLSEPVKQTVRMTMRQAEAAGLSEDTAITFGRVAAHSGMNIVFDSIRSGAGDALQTGNTIYIDPGADKSRIEKRLLIHEMAHALIKGANGWTLLQDAFRSADPTKAKKISKQYISYYKKLGMDAAQYMPIVNEEIAVSNLEDLLGRDGVWDYMLADEPSLGEKVLNFFRGSARDYADDAGLSAESRKLLTMYRKMFRELSERRRGGNALELAEQAKMAGDIDDARFSLKFKDVIAENQRKAAENRTHVSFEDLEKAIADTDHMAQIMQKHEKILPRDKEGKTLVKNGSYDVTVENTTICLRTLSYNAFVDMVSEKIHRPLSQMESFLVSQKLYDIAKEPQCLYCYVSLDRKAYNEMLLRYISQRDEAVKAYKAAGMPDITRSSDLYEEFRNKRKDTDEMWGRYRGWIDAVKRGEHLLTADEIATEDRRIELVNGGGSAANQVKDMLKYAQSASWAKKQTQYAAYFGDILKLSPRVVNNLNRHYGLRWYSFSDYSGAFIVENMQQITDAAIRGLKGLSYTKDTDFAKIFAPTGMNINISVYAKKVGDHYEIDPKQSADLNEAIALRKKYPNVGIVAVATDQAGVEWALEQEWSDVVIPFHTVRTGAQVAEFYDWTVFNEEQSDLVKDENLWKAYVDDVAAGKSDSAKKKVSKMVYPSEHQNNREKYLELIAQRGLKPRFSSFLDNPNYMKLVNETRQSEAQTSALKPVYDLDAAERSFAKFVDKGGYYEGWYNDGIDVDAEAEIVARDIRAGKKANEVEYGRQDVDYEQISKGRKSQRVHGERLALPEDDIIDLNEDEYLKSAVKGIYGSSKYKIIADYIYERLGERDIILSDGRMAVVDKRDASHIAKESADKKTAQISKIEEIVKKAQPYAFDSKVVHNKFNYFYYYRADVRYGEDVFPIYLNVGRSINDSRWHIYDITNKIRDTADRINGLERPKPNEGYALTNDISNGRIAQTKPKVNRNDKISSKDRLALPENGKKKKKYHMSHGQLRADVANKTRKKAYSKADARATLEGFTGAELLTKKVQNELSDYLWQGFNTCETPEQRQKFARGFSTEYAEKLFAMDGIFDDMRGNKREAMALGFERQIMQAFEERGHLSVFQKRVGYLLEQYADMAEEAKAKYDEINGRNEILGRISAVAQKMKELKLGTFKNSTQMESEVFIGAVKVLANIEYRGNLSVKKAKTALRELAKWYRQDTSALMYVDEQNSGYYNAGVAEMLNELTADDEPFTKEQLMTLHDVLSYFTKFAENYGKIWRAGKWVEAKPIAERYVQTLLDNEKIGLSLIDRLMRTKYLKNFGDPASVVRQMDRYQRGFYTEIYEELRAAAEEADVLRMNVMIDYDAFMKKNPKYIRDVVKQQVVWTEAGRTNAMPKMTAISLYMTSKREQAQAGLALNGFKFKDADGKVTRTAGAIIRNPDDPRKVTQAEISQAMTELQNRLKKQFSAEDLAYIKILEKAYGYDLRSLKAERDMQKMGFTNATLDYYYPIRRADIAKSIDVSAFAELDRVSNASFNKNTVQGARGKLFIEDADALFQRHATAVTRYAALSPAIENFNILFNMDISGNPNDSVSVATVGESQWEDAKNYFRDLIGDIQGVPKNTGEYSKELSALRSHVAMSQLGANPKTWVTQFSSLFAASSRLDPVSIMQGMRYGTKDVDIYCDLAKLRNYDAAAIKAQGVLDRVSHAGEVLMKPIAATDRLVVCSLWGACQVQVQKNQNLKLGTDENKVAAGKLLTEVLLETQQNSLATEKSSMMRSGNEILRALTMFSADGMKVTGRYLDGLGEVSALKQRIKAMGGTADDATKEALKQATKRMQKALAAMVSSAVFSVAIAEGFRLLYAKEREEDESAVLDMILDFTGNMLGGLPGLRDVHTFMVDGYELDNYAISAVNDLLSSVKSSFDLVWNFLRGEGDPAEIPAKVKSLSYATGQFMGIPVRNIYNLLTGLTRRFSPVAGYQIDRVFYSKNYRNDLREAVEAGDTRMVAMLTGIIHGKDASGEIGDEGMTELNRLAMAGANVMPRTIGKKITVDGEEVELDQEQQGAITEAYEDAWSEGIAELMKSDSYAKMTDEQREDAIRKVHDISYERALLNGGFDRGERSVILASAVGLSKAAVYYATVSGMEADVDRKGNKIEGSRRTKTVAAIEAMTDVREERLLLLTAAGYSLQAGDFRFATSEDAKRRLLRYIVNMKGLSAEEKAAIAQMCGFEVKNGKVSAKSLSA